MVAELLDVIVDLVVGGSHRPKEPALPKNNSGSLGWATGIVDREFSIQERLTGICISA